MLSKHACDAIRTGNYETYALGIIDHANAEIAAIRRKTVIELCVLVALLVTTIVGTAAHHHHRFGLSWSSSFALLNPLNDPIEVLNRG